MATKKKKEPQQTDPDGPATPEQMARMKELLRTRKVNAKVAYTLVEEIKKAKKKPMKETKSEEHKENTESIRFTMSVKEAILFHLWTYTGSPGQTEEMRAQIQETHNVLKEGLQAIRIKDIDRAEGAYTYEVVPTPGWEEEGKTKLLQEHMATAWARLAVADMYGFREELIAANKAQEADRPKHVKTGKHLVSQFLGPVDPQTKLNFTDTIERYTQETGLTMGNRPMGWGLDLSVAQQRVTSAILEAFSRNEYQGQITLPKEEVLTDPERGPHILPGKWKGMGPGAMARKAYKDIPHLPTIRLSLAEIVELAGYEHDRQGDKQKVMEAIDHLRTHLYLFWWKRKAFNIVDGVAVPDRDGKGEHRWEEREDVSPLFRIVFVRDEQTKVLKYFEISPSAVVLDQVNPTYQGNYFLMVPRDLHTQVVKAIGKGQRSSSYTFAFLVYLLDEYDRIRRHAKKGTAPKHTIAKPWEEIAQRIKMPESIWKRKRANAVARLEQVYQVAKELGYLKSYSRADGVDTLELEPSKYYRPGKDQEQLLGEAEEGAEA